MLKRQSIIRALNASTVISFIVGFTIIALLITEAFGNLNNYEWMYGCFIFFAVFIFISVFIDIILSVAAAKIKTRKQAIVCAVFSFITLNITAGIKFLQLNSEDLSQIIEYKKGRPYYNGQQISQQKRSSFVSTDNVDKLRTLEQYRALYNQGLISEEEFEKKKEELLK